MKTHVQIHVEQDAQNLPQTRKLIQSHLRSDEKLPTLPTLPNRAPELLTHAEIYDSLDSVETWLLMWNLRNSKIDHDEGRNPTGIQSVLKGVYDDIQNGALDDYPKEKKVHDEMTKESARLMLATKIFLISNTTTTYHDTIRASTPRNLVRLMHRDIDNSNTMHPICLQKAKVLTHLKRHYPEEYKIYSIILQTENFSSVDMYKTNCAQRNVHSAEFSCRGMVR